LHGALRQVLGESVGQAGSDINAERLRFDFTFPRKLTPEELGEIECQVNQAIEADYPISKEEMTYEAALESGALAFFKLKYPPQVTVYTVGDKKKPFSREVCGGPHLTHTGELSHVKIKKEEAVGAGVRRIRAIIT